MLIKKRFDWEWLVRGRPALASLIAMMLMGGCGDAQDRTNVASLDFHPPSKNRSADQDDLKQEQQKLRILFLGNSHTSFNDVPGLVEQLIESGGAKTVTTKLMSGSFLDGIAARRDVQEAIKTGGWNVVVMQGHKISGSGRFIYSTDAAEKLSKLSHDSGAQVVWYSEWARRGVKGESERTQKIYQQISDVNHDRLAPVGEAWKAVFAKRPQIVLHRADGNHANAQGALLAALTLSVAITGDDCAMLPAIQLKEIDTDTQAFFKTTVSGVTQHLLSDKKQ